MSDGCFVVVEGPDGAGKSTLVAALSARMREQGVDHLAVREPGGTPVAEALRSELLADGRKWEAGAELLYMVTARADLVARVIRPALDAGKVVISDRYDLSTLAYQGAGRGLPAEQVRWVNNAATGGLIPDVTLVLDVDTATGEERRASAGKGDRLDREDAGFHQRVAEAYLAAEGPGVHHLNGGASPEAVMDAAWQALVTARPDRFRLVPGQEDR